MTRAPRLLALGGSMRKASYNQKLVTIAAEAARRAGAEVTLASLGDFDLPVFNQDDEAAGGLPEAALRLKALMRANDGFLISSPEYNSSISGAFKNAIDWASRKETKEEPSLVCFTGKWAALMAASPGALGGLRGLVHLRAILGNIGVHVIPDQKAIVSAHEVFDGEGKLKDEKQQAAIENIATKLTEMLKKQLAE